MEKISMHRMLLAAAALSVFGCAPPKMNTPVAEIPKLATLAQVMDNQATVADPQFGKRDQTSFTDEDWAAFATMSERLQATAAKTKDFSKGAEFDALANQLGEKAKALGTAASAKDAAGAGAALKDIKATCKTCHTKFR